MVAADFEKDDDSNGHIDFIAAAAVSIIHNKTDMRRQIKSVGMCSVKNTYMRWGSILFCN